MTRVMSQKFYRVTCHYRSLYLTALKKKFLAKILFKPQFKIFLIKFPLTLTHMCRKTFFQDFIFYFHMHIRQCERRKKHRENLARWFNRYAQKDQGAFHFMSFLISPPYHEAHLFHLAKYVSQPLLNNIWRKKNINRKL